MKIERTRLVSRGGGQRDARLFVIATEGHVTEKQYFEGLQAQGIVDRLRVIVQVLTDEEDRTRSAPEHVLARLDEFAQRFRLVEGLDELWLVTDLDHWGAPGHLKNLTGAIREATQKGYRVAVSNPCFELWLLLHFTGDIADIQAQSRPHDACHACEERIRAICGSFNKTKLRIGRYTRERVYQAITRARTLDTSERDRWPRSPGSHVHRLASALLEQSRRNAFPPPAR